MKCGLVRTPGFCSALCSLWSLWGSACKKPVASGATATATRARSAAPGPTDGDICRPHQHSFREASPSTLDLVIHQRHFAYTLARNRHRCRARHYNA